MNEKELLLLRLHNQQISQQSFERPEDLVSWMGAIQAQDYVMAKWAIGLRLRKATDQTLEDAVASGAILRTHILRPTWHFVAAADIRWMLELSAPRILSQMAYFDRKLEIDQKEIAKSIKLMEKTLAGQKQMTRPELSTIFSKAGFNCDGMRFGHLLMHTELRSIICSGPRKGKHNTYTLLEERVAPGKKISKQDGLMLLAQKYFQSHGPATAKDFIWWSGLAAKEAKEAIALLGEKIKAVKIQNEDYWYCENNITVRMPSSVYLLPNYDEYTVAYSNRNIIMADQAVRKVSRGGNPLFSNVVLIHGKIEGTWKREIKAKSMQTTYDLYAPFSVAKQKQLNAAQKVFEQFSGYSG